MTSIDSCHADLAAMQEVGLSLFARGVHTASFGQAHIVSDLNIPIQCAGVLIAPGDVLVGDPEGVIAIPQAVAAQAAEAGLEQELRDTFEELRRPRRAAVSTWTPRLRAGHWSLARQRQYGSTCSVTPRRPAPTTSSARFTGATSATRKPVVRSSCSRVKPCRLYHRAAGVSHDLWGACGASHCHAGAARRESSQYEPARDYYRQALALAEELGLRPLVAHCRLGLGKLYATSGRRAETRAELSTAIELYRAMEMTFWLPQAEATLAQVG